MSVIGAWPSALMDESAKTLSIEQACQVSSDRGA
jgi:hypothetical protein